MYRCGTCIYKKVCQGAMGSKTCDGYILDNANNRQTLADAQKEREQAEFDYINKQAEERNKQNKK